MSTSPIVERYSNAVFQACPESERQAALDALRSVLEVFQEADIWSFLMHPNTSSAQKRKLLESFDLPSPVRAFIDLVIEKRRLALFPGMVDEFARLVRAADNRTQAVITVAGPISDTQQKRLASALQNLTGKQVSLDIRVDQGILGGLVVEINGQVIDGSIANELARLRRRLSTA